MNRFYIFFIIFTTVFFYSRIFAQDDGIRDKIEDIKLEKLTGKLSLDENTKEKFIDKYKSFSSEMRELNKKRAMTYKKMAENVENGSGLDSLVNLLLEYENTINLKRTGFIAELQSMLTSQQIAKMIIFERKFNNELKKLLKQYQKENRKNFDD